MSSIVFPEIRVSLDIGCRLHSVAVGLADGELLDEFEIEHTKAGFESFFNKISRHEAQYKLPVSIAMEGYNGYARPLDQMIRARNYRLFNINNLKLARFKEIFPGAAKSDAIDAARDWSYSSFEITCLWPRMCSRKSLPRRLKMIS